MSSLKFSCMAGREQGRFDIEVDDERRKKIQNLN
jgi:hypothetical protein